LSPAPRLSISAEEIYAVYAQGAEAMALLVQALVERINRVEERLETLENQKSKTSLDSSKPPSGDGFGKRTESLRQRRERSTGGQPEHPGSTLEWREDVSEVVEHPVLVCRGCGETLSPASVTGTVVHQVHDLPAMQLEVTAHRGEVKCCLGCGLENRAPFPLEAQHRVQYGPRLKGWMMYLMEAQLIPAARTCEMLSELVGVEISAGTLFNTRAQCFDALAPVETAIETQLQTATLAHFDETGLRVNGKLWWLHVVCTRALTDYSVQLKRGQAAMDVMNILPNFKGKALHDGWKSYQVYDRCQHFLCNAHHLRELKFIWERHHQPWAYQMSLFLSSAKAIVDQARASGLSALDPVQLQPLAARYHRLLDEGLAANPATPDLEPDTPKKRGRPKQSAAKNLLDRLKTQQTSVLGFVHDFEVPFDNNQAERDIRMMKLKQKISGSFRSHDGAQMFCRIRGYLSTLRKQGIDVLDALTSLFMGDLIVPDYSAE
jgi:transposase